ncbi:DedA family protein [Tessaracoccus sp. OH4464_COT-324]|uniref:DedA family protein n=1 Tax=Tessaracoccus sp. OH4464_COT-324 TaxID=2491059 RepID=UPI001319EC97|nr:VTT domain-containing protein [Tessaracoccus sp. OH4464_COT-324]
MHIVLPLEAQWWNPMSWTEAPLALVVGALWLISMLRSNGTYWIGRMVARGTGQSRWRGLLESRHYRRAQNWLNQWGPLAVVMCFLTIGLLTMVNLAAGITRMSLPRYLVSVSIGCLIWAMIYGTVGFIGFVAIAKLWELSPASVLGLSALLVGAVCYLWFSSRRRRSMAAAQA